MTYIPFNRDPVPILPYNLPSAAETERPGNLGGRFRGLSEEERAQLQLPDEREKIDRIIERNRPDEPGKGRSGP
jgi:hypothetical protein